MSNLLYLKGCNPIIELLRNVIKTHHRSPISKLVTQITMKKLKQTGNAQKNPDHAKRKKDSCKNLIVANSLYNNRK